MSLTIAIPTYNRNMKLLAQLKRIEQQDCKFLQEILIIDNGSDDPIKATIDGALSACFRSKIKVVENGHNIGMSVNLVLPFLYAENEWLWLLSDDDEILETSLATIQKDIKTSDTIGMIKYPLSDRASSVMLSCYREFVEHCENEISITPGELVFYSNCVYKMKAVKNYIGCGFENANTYIGFMYPAFEMLNSTSESLLYSASPIVKYVPPEDDGYSYVRVALALTRVWDYELGSQNDLKKRFTLLFQSITSRRLLFNILIKESSVDAKTVVYLFYKVFRFQPLDPLPLAGLLLSNIKIFRSAIKHLKGLN